MLYDAPTSPEEWKAWAEVQRREVSNRRYELNDSCYRAALEALGRIASSGDPGKDAAWVGGIWTDAWCKPSGDKGADIDHGGSSDTSRSAVAPTDGSGWDIKVLLWTGLGVAVLAAILYIASRD